MTSIPDNVTQIRGTPLRRLHERLEEFIDEHGEPDITVVISHTPDGMLYAQAFTGPNALLSHVVGAIELGKRKVTEDWFAEDT